MNTFDGLFSVLNAHWFSLYCVFAGLVFGWFSSKIHKLESFKIVDVLKGVYKDLLCVDLAQLWLVALLAAMTWISLSLGSPIDEMVCSITGVLCVFLIAKGKSSSYFWGMITTVLYTWVSFKYKLYGETIVYAFLYIPLQIIGYYWWVKYSSETENVHTKTLTNKQRVWVVIGTIITIAIYAAFLTYLKGALPGLDAATSVMGIVAMFLMVRRYAEQWLMWIAVNVTAVAIWVNAVLAGHNEQPVAMLAMFIVFTLNAIYGWYVWSKKANEKT